MYRNKFEKNSQRFIDSLHEEASRGHYSLLASSIIERLVAPTVIPALKKSEPALHLRLPRRWNDESICLVVSNIALQHVIDTGLLAQTKEQTMRTTSALGDRVPISLQNLRKKNQAYKEENPGFKSPFEVKRFGEALEFVDGQTSWVYYKPIVLVDEVYANAQALTTNHVETMAEQINGVLLSPALQRPVW